MPLFYQQDINEATRLGVWKIEEEEDFFLEKVSLHLPVSHPHKRKQHLAGRYLLPFLFPDFPNEEIEIADTRKPFLRDEQYHFSISHTGDFAAALVSQNERTGIDIEMISPRVEKIRHKFLDEDELHFVLAHEPALQTALLTLLWSSKEALFKWWGSGEVDFRKDLILQPFHFSHEGIIHSLISKDDDEIKLDVFYQMRDGSSLAWVLG